MARPGLEWMPTLTNMDPLNSTPSDWYISKFDGVIQPVVLQEVLGSFNLRVLLSFHILCQLAKVDSPL